MLTLHPLLLYKRAFQMMKNKVFIFTIGLIAGLTIGVLFSVAIKELITQFKELHLSLNRINLRQSQLSQRLDSIQGKLVPDTKKPINTITQTPKKQAIPANTKNTAQQDVKNSAPVKTVDSITAGAEEDSNIVVMTNQLVSVLSIHLRNDDTNSISKKSEETDSTLASMSDVGNLTVTTNYRIEFWKSPLNYKGYKMSDGKIIVYGLTPDTPINITLTDDTYYLQVGQVVYKMELTDEYRPLEKVLDKTILKKLSI